MSKDERPSPQSIRFPDDIKQKINREAKKKDRSFSWVVIKIVEDYFKKPKPDPQ